MAPNLIQYFLSAYFFFAFRFWWFVPMIENKLRHLDLISILRGNNLYEREKNVQNC